MEYEVKVLNGMHSIQEHVKRMGHVVLDFAQYPRAKGTTASLVDINSANIDQLPRYYLGGPVAVRVPVRHPYGIDAGYHCVKSR